MRVDEPLAAGAHDYADAFELRVDEPDGRTAVQWLRAGLQDAPPVLRWVIVVAHRQVLRFRLAPRSSPGHLLGWRIALSTGEVARLTAAGPLMRAAIVVRRVDPTRLVLTTCLDYERPTAARRIWWLVAPVHRRVARYLLGYAAAGADRATATAG